MDRLQKRYKNTIYDLIYSIMVFSLVYMVSIGVGLKLNKIIQFPIIVFSSLLVKFFLFNPIVLYIILFLGLLILLLIHRFYHPIIFIIGERLYFLFTNILDNVLGKENISSENIILFWIFIIVLISLFTAIVIFKLKRIYILLPVYTLPFLYYWYNFYDEAYWTMALFLLSFIILMGLNKYTSIKIDILHNQGFKTITAYSILIVALALILPKTYNYIRWPWLQEKVYTYFPFVEDLRSYDTYGRKAGNANLFDFSVTGFQTGNSKLGGPVSLNHKKVMTVRSDEPTYLRGNVKHIYTGDSWKAYEGEFKKRKLSDRLSGLLSFERKSFFEEKYITIKYQDLATNTVFSPYLPDSMYFRKGESIFVNDDHVLVIPDGIYKSETYTIKVQKPYPYGILLSKGIYKSKEDIEKLDIYLQVPEDKITEETKDLVKAIVRNRETDFDKAVAIERYLRENYEYTYDVKEVPEGAEFVSHFLFNERKGYCTYFATSMAIMLRLEGIPTRYVEGYLASDEVEPGVYEVSNKNAHTWVEAFIEPVGWMTFEPTPAYPVQERMVDYQAIEESENDLNLIELPIGSRNDILNEEITDDSRFTRNEGSITNNLPTENTSNSSKNIGSRIIGITLVLIFIRFLRSFVYYKFEAIKYKKLTNNEKIIYLYKQILRLAELFGYPQKYGETHYEYADRVANKFYYHSEKNLKQITHIFVKSKYSPYLSSDEDVNELTDFRQTLNKHLKNYLGLRKYLYRKYIKMDV
ncbi:MAG: transglutaminase domain-containing protein [Tissierellia bacterium]|nr:transglutaminase domain-containing protein [Tissierellia bacterium]